MATMNPFNVGKPTPNAFGTKPKAGGQVTGGGPIVSQPIQPSGPVSRPVVSQPAQPGGQVVNGGGPLVSQPIQPGGPVGGGPLVSQPIRPETPTNVVSQPGGITGGGPLVSQPIQAGGNPLVSQPPTPGGMGGNKPQVSQPPMPGAPGSVMGVDKQQLDDLGNELFRQYGSDEGAMARDPRYAKFREMAQRLNAARQQQQIWNEEANKRIAVNGMMPR